MNFAQVTKPASSVIMPETYVRALAQFAYIWGWPLVNMVNRRALIVQAPVPGLNGGIVPVAPRGRIKISFHLPRRGRRSPARIADL
jgi:hypothetical protein